MILTGESLGKRQQDLNSKVHDAAAKNITLEELKDDDSDVFNLFKIDLASKYKNVDYIIETLKCGDDLYISRAMKCLWLYNAEFQNVVNTDYLHHNVFPFMSIKMKKKLLTTISTYVRDEVRALQFYQYCMNTYLGHFAFKFLIFTSLEFRTDMIKNNFRTLRSIMKNDKDIIYVVGNNFLLAELYQNKSYHNLDTWCIFSYLYSVDANRYLNTLETYFDVGLSPSTRLGLRISKDIMLKHKSRILKYIQSYYKLLNLSMFRKYTTVEEAKLYATHLLPNTSYSYWPRYSTECKTLLDLIPTEERYKFIKDTFEAKYPNCEFEMAYEFYKQEYYKFMSVDDRESWALRHLANPNKSFLSEREDKEFLWYRFVDYKKALPGIKKYVLITPGAYERERIVNILIHTTRNEDQLQNLLQYYYERHVNEDRSIKHKFLNEIIEHNLVWEFNEYCWASFNKLLISIDFYDSLSCPSSDYDIVIPVLFYHILHDQQLPGGLQLTVKEDIFFQCFYYVPRYSCRINNEEKKDKIYQYLKQLCLNKLEPNYEILRLGDYVDVNNRAKMYTAYLKNLLEHFNKPDENLPEVVLNLMKPPCREIISQPKMIRLLKQDAQSVLSKILLLENDFSSSRYLKINTFLRKIKVYFTDDIAHDFLKYFSESISRKADRDNLFAAVHDIFVLANKQFNTEFMTKYAPDNPKIDHSTIDRKHLYVQEAICRFACYSRPLVPLEYVRMYIKGDYVHFCLPLLYMYAAKFPQHPCSQFIADLIDNSVSIQKHGLRLAFKCFSCDQLKNIILKAWARSKNISLRMVIYTYLVKHIIYSNDGEKLDLLKILLTLSSEINEEDDAKVIEILTSGIHEVPNDFKNLYFKTAWTTINRFPNDNMGLERKSAIIKTITRNISLIDYEFVYQIVNDYLDDEFNKKHIIQKDNINFTKLYKDKCDLTTTFIVTYDDEENIKNGLKLVHFILTKCFEMWLEGTSFDEINQYNFVRSYCHNFIDNLTDKHFALEKRNVIAINVLFEYIIQTLRENLPVPEIYLLVWRLRLAIITNNVLDTAHFKLKIYDSDDYDNERKKTAEMYATEIFKIVNEFVDQGQFYQTLLESISKEVKHFFTVIKSFIPNPYSKDFDTFTTLAVEMVNFKTTESMLMAIHILPFKPNPDSTEEHKYVKKTIRQFENFEVQALLYEKMFMRFDVDNNCF